MTKMHGDPSPLETRVLAALAGHGRLTRQGLIDAISRDGVRKQVADESIMLSCRRLMRAGLVRKSHDLEAPNRDLRGYRITDAGWQSLRQMQRELHKMSVNAAIGLSGRRKEES